MIPAILAPGAAGANGLWRPSHVPGTSMRKTDSVSPLLARRRYAAVLLVALLTAACGPETELQPPGVSDADAQAISLRAIHNVLDLYEQGMIDRDVDLLESLLSDTYRGPDGKNEIEKLREWAGDYPPKLMKYRGFLSEVTNHFRLSDREVRLYGEFATVRCTARSQRTNKASKVRETRAEGLEFQLRRERGDVGLRWQIVSVRSRPPVGLVWSDEMWYPHERGGLPEHARTFITSNLYDEHGVLPAASYRVRAPGRDWVPMQACRLCTTEEREQDPSSCCLSYCISYCTTTYLDIMDLSEEGLADFVGCVEAGCVGTIVEFSPEPGTGRFVVEMEDEAGAVLTVEHRLQRVDWGPHSWEHHLPEPVDPAEALLLGEVPKENIVLSVAIDRAGVVWFGTRQGRIYRYDPRTETTPRLVRDLDGGPYEEGMSVFSVNTIAIDTRGRIWFGLSGVLYDQDQNILGKSGGVVRFDGREWTDFDGPLFGEGRDPNVIEALADDRGGVWFCGQGVRYWDGEQERFTHHFTQEDGLGAEDVNCMVFDNAGRLWCGTSIGGISRFDGSSWTTYTFSPHTPDNVKEIEHAVSDILDSIARGDPLRIVLDPLGLANGVAKEDMIWSAARDERGHLWFGTYGGGLLVFRGGDPADRRNWDLYTAARSASDRAQGLLGNVIKAVAPDGHGRIWVSGLDGINALDHNGTRDPGDDVWHTYRVDSMSDLLGDPEDFPYVSTAWDIEIDGQGTPWFATIGGGILHLKGR